MTIKVTREIGKGVIYVDTSADKRAFKAFKHASEVYKAKHNKQLVIAYNNI
ncbi:22334_t:CDS:2, partial [Gigaspora rosea]